MAIKKYHVSKNLCDESQLRHGYFGNTSPYDFTADEKYRCFSINLTAGTYSILVYGSNLVMRLIRVSSLSLGNNYVNKDNESYTFTIDVSETVYITFRNIDTTIDFSGLTVMFNTGDTVLSYEPYGNTWVEIPYRKYGTETDTLTTLPAEVIADGNNATVGISGNMAQSGTPTPQNPIEPSECGERTGNLFDKNWLVEGYTLDFNTGLPSANELRIATTSPVDVSDVTQITVSYTVSGWTRDILFIYSILKNGSLVERMAGNNSGDTVNIGDADELYLCFYDSQLSPENKITSDNLTNLMVNSGSTSLPYEPYGQYKIQIKSGGTTTNVYLGEVQSTRQIKKYEFTGTENFQNISTSASIFGVYGLFNEEKYIPQSGAFSTHYHYIPNQSDLTNVMHNNDFVMFKQSESLYNIAFKDTLYSDITDFKGYLAAQYAAGTPVTVWYVLATETTGIVNEPIRKIGDYADTVSGISVPTLGTSEQFDVDTTLKPSEVDLTYTGWHNKSDTKF